MTDYIAKAADNGETLANYDHGAAGRVNIMDGDRVISSIDPTPSREVVLPPGEPHTSELSASDETSQLTPEDRDRLDVEDFKRWRLSKRAKRNASETVSPSVASSALQVAQDPFDADVLEKLQAVISAARLPQEQRSLVSPQLPSSATVAVVSASQDSDLDMSRLGLAFLGYSSAQRAKVPVVFRGSMGIMTVPYHAVIVTPKLVALVYDTRYDQGVQFLPAVSQDELEVDVPSQSTGPMKCVSLDISWSLGCMDIAILLREQ